MDQLAHPIRQFMAFSAKFRSKDLDGPVVRMSDINHSFSDTHSASESFNLTENFKNISSKVSKLSESGISGFEIHEISMDSISSSNANKLKMTEVLHDELNELDFQKFVDDISMHAVERTEFEMNAENDPNINSPRNRIIYERTDKKETIIIDSIPNPNSDKVQVVKVKIILPRGSKDAPIICHPPITHYTSTFKKSTINALKAARLPGNQAVHLPIMGKAALMNKHNANCIKNNDSEIIKELVTQRFQDFLINYYEKSFQRQNSRILPADIITDSEEEPEKRPKLENPRFSSTLNNDLNGISSIASTSIDSALNETSAPVTGTASNCSSPNSLNRNEADEFGQTYDNHDEMYQNNDIFRQQNKNFLLSTDDHNVETSNEENLTHTTLAQTTNAQANYSEEQFNPQEFLQNALGDELDRYSSTNTSCLNNSSRNDSIDTLNALPLHQDTFTCQPYVNNSIDVSLGTSNISAMITSASNFTEPNVGNDTLENDTNKPTEYEYDYYPYAYNDRVNQLLIQAKVQRDTIEQTGKALIFCKSTKEFNASTEELEAERILLIATCKSEAIRDEIRRLEYEEVIYPKPNSYGCIKITKVVLPPKQRNPLFSKVFDKKKKKEFTEWFLCVMTNGPEVLATKAVRADDDGIVRFQDEVTFDHLSIDFEINIAFYSLRVRNQMRNMSHESKFHLDKEPVSMCPLSPPKLFNNCKRYKSITIPNTSISQQSSFIMCGQYTLRINNIGHLGNFKLCYLTLPSLEGNFIMDFASTVRINEDYSGFLNIGLESGETISWNRRWCSLVGPLLTYYNYPGEEIPLGFIDLQYCAIATIALADRQICARPRTLLVEIFNNVDDSGKTSEIIKYFLAADSRQYMEMWENKLNSTINALRTWNAMKCKAILKRH